MAGAIVYSVDLIDNKHTKLVASRVDEKRIAFFLVQGETETYLSEQAAQVIMMMRAANVKG